MGHLAHAARACGPSPSAQADGEGAGGRKRFQHRAARLRRLLAEEPCGRGDSLVEEAEDDLVLRAHSSDDEIPGLEDL
jgi:hypothetical protein